MLKLVRETACGRGRSIRLTTDGIRFVGQVIADGKERLRIDGEDERDVWRRLLDAGGAAAPGLVGWDGARRRFLAIFGDGFADPGYGRRERAYKDAARARLIEMAPVEAAATGAGFAPAVRQVFAATNLLASFESVRVGALLTGAAADDVVRAAARFALDPSRTTLGALALTLRPGGAATWPVATYLPYLWLPDRHMFLKPEVTKSFGDRVGHPFASAYRPLPDFATYVSLLDLVDRIGVEIADLRPADNIDAQSFLWVVAAYTDDDAGLVGAVPDNP